MDRIYISGKISDLSVDEYSKRFIEAEMKLVEFGYQVINPVKIGEKLPENSEWSDYMRADIIELMKCDVIYMLSNWKESKGAKIEQRIARELGLRMMYEK